ncbi:hypothetical protein AB1N83_009044 [Pleurotus pulmonarius]
MESRALVLVPSLSPSQKVVGRHHVMNSIVPSWHFDAATSGRIYAWLSKCCEHIDAYSINIGIQVWCLQTKRTNADWSDRSMGVNDFKALGYRGSRGKGFFRRL